MKKLLCVFLASIAISSCSSDDENQPTENIIPIKPVEQTKGKFTLDNVTYDVTFGLITTLKNPNNISSTSINLKYTNSDESETINISLAIFQETSKSISGTYNLGNWTKGEIGILDNYLTSYSIGVNTTDGLIIRSSNTRDISGVKEGFLTIKENGNKNYTIKYNLLFENGKTSSADTTLDLLENRQ